MKKSTILYCLVFLGGVICANILGIASGKELGAMNEYFLNRYMYTDIQGRELFLFLFYERVPQFLLLVFLSIGIYGTLIIDGYICYLGFSVGFLSVIAIMNYGIKGILLMIGFFFPQWLFYIPVIVIWYYELSYYKGNRRNYQYREGNRGRHMRYTVAFFLAGILMLSGIFVESYVNSFFLQKVISIM